MVRSKAKLTSKSQLTLPRSIRAALGVGPGDTITFEMNDDGVRVRPERRAGAFEKWEGRFRIGRGRSADEIDRRLRELRGRTDE